VAVRSVVVNPFHCISIDSSAARPPSGRVCRAGKQRRCKPLPCQKSGISESRMTLRRCSRKRSPNQLPRPPLPLHRLRRNRLAQRASDQHLNRPARNQQARLRLGPLPLRALRRRLLPRGLHQRQDLGPLFPRPVPSVKAAQAAGDPAPATVLATALCCGDGWRSLPMRLLLRALGGPCSSPRALGSHGLGIPLGSGIPSENRDPRARWRPMKVGDSAGCATHGHFRQRTTPLTSTTRSSENGSTQRRRERSGSASRRRPGG